MIILDGCIGSCPILFFISCPVDLFSRICVPNKTKDINVKVFSIVTGMNKAKTEVQHVSCNFKCKFDGKNVIQLKNGVLTSVDMRAKN